MGRLQVLGRTTHASPWPDWHNRQRIMNEHVPAVFVIVAAYNSADFLPRCLGSLKQQGFRDFETIVVNSSQEMRTAEIM